MADRSVLVRLKGDSSDFDRMVAGASAKTKAFRGELDSSSDRMSNLVQTALALGPALVPIGAAAIPAIAGLTTHLSAAAGAAGVAVLAFSGVGDALSALNDYELEPSSANLEKLNEAMATLGPAGQNFARFLHEIRPEMQALQDTAQAGLFPGLEDGITALMTRGPEVTGIIAEISSTMGDLSRDAGQSLASDRWTEFFDYVRTQARPTLTDMGYALGDVTEGLANMMMAFDPLSDDFSGGMRDAAADFRDWSDSVSETEGFQEFLAYIQRVGPEAMSTLGSVGGALLEIVEAAAPVGEASLPIIRALADVIGAVADSPAGPALIAAAAGISAVSRAVALYNAAQGSALMGLLGGGKNGTAAGAGFRAAGAGVGVLALSLTDLDDKLGVSNTAMGAAIGMLGGPWGAAIGATIGATMDLTQANDELEESLQRLNEVAGTDAPMAKQKKALADAREELEKFTEKAETGILDKEFWLDAPWDTAFKSIKNTWEGWFGNSDVEERTKSFESAAKKIAKLQVNTSVDAQAKIAAEETASAFDMLGDSASTAADQAQGLADALYAVIDPSLEADKAALSMKEGWKELIDTLEDTGGAWDETTKKGLKSQIAIQEQAKLTIDAATKGFGDDGNVERLTKSLERSRDKLIDIGTSMGVPKKQLRELVNEMFNIPELVQTQIEMRGDGAARSRVRALRKEYGLTPKQFKTLVSEAGANPTKKKIAELAKQYNMTPRQVRTILSAQDDATPTIRAVRSELASIPQTVTSTVVIRRSGKGGGGGMTSEADGGVLDFYASGGMSENHTAQIAPAGTWRVWAEPETGGEAYIPLAESKRGRSLDIWAETGRRLGVQGFANGGLNTNKDPKDDVNIGALIRGFRINPRMDRSDIRSEVSELLSGLDDAFGKNSALFKSADRLGDRLLANAKALDENRKDLEEYRGLRSDLIGDVRSSLTHDPFEGGLADFRTQTDADRNDASAFQRSLAQARNKGLDGNLFRDLAGSVNLALMQEFAGLSAAQIEREEVRYRGAQSAIGSAATYAGDAQYGREIAKLERTQGQLVKGMARFDKRMDKMVARFEKGAEVGTEKGVRAGMRGTASRSRRSKP